MCLQVLCCQHATASCLAPMTQASGIFSKSFSAACALASGQTTEDVRSTFRTALLEDMMIAEPDEWVPDLEAEGYAKALLENCYENRMLFRATDDAEYVKAQAAYRQQRGIRLRSLLPGRWYLSRVDGGVI